MPFVDYMFFTLLYILVLLAYSVAINSHGTARTVLSFLIATVVLLGAVFTTVDYMSKEKVRKLEGMREKEEREKIEALKRVERESELRVKDKQLSAENQFTDFASDCVDKALALTEEILYSNPGSEDVSDDQFEAIMAKSKRIKYEAKKLQDSWNGTRVDVPGFEKARSSINDGMRYLIQAADSFVNWFHSEDESEEAQRMNQYKASARAAKENLEKADRLLQTKK